MKPTYELGIAGEIQKLCKASNNTNNQVWNNKAEQDATNLELFSNQVEAVIDEYLCVVGEERE